MTSPVDGPTATLPTTYDPSSATLNSSGTGKAPELLDSQAFLQLLVAQLKYQDPTNPVDTSEFMNQTAMLSQVQTMNTMSSTLSEMMSAQQTASATAMLGKAISFLDPAGNQVAGLVEAVSMNHGVPMLHVGDLAVPLSGVIAVGEPVPVDNSAAAGDAGTGTDTGTSDATDSAGGTSGTGSSDTTGAASDASGTGDATPDTGSDTAPAAGSTDTGAAADPTTTAAPTIRPDLISA